MYIIFYFKLYILIDLRSQMANPMETKMNGEIQSQDADGNEISEHYEDGKLVLRQAKKKDNGNEISEHYVDGKLILRQEKKKADGSEISEHYADGKLVSLQEKKGPLDISKYYDSAGFLSYHNTKYKKCRVFLHQNIENTNTPKLIKIMDANLDMKARFIRGDNMVQILIAKPTPEQSAVVSKYCPRAVVQGDIVCGMLTPIKETVAKEFIALVLSTYDASNYA